MPAVDEGFAVVIGRLRRIAQPVRRVAVHAGFARHDPLAPHRGRVKDRIDAVWCNCCITTDGCGAMGKGQVQIPPSNLGGVIGVGQAHFLGEGIAVQPVDQPLAPARDARRLWIMGMGVDKARADQRIPVIGDLCVWMGLAQCICRPDCNDMAILDQDAARTVD